MIGWLGSLADAEPVLAVMRQLRDQATRLEESYRDMAKHCGSRLPVGGAHFDYWVKGQALSDFLGAIGKGRTPEEAMAFAKGEACLAIKKWNANPRAVSITGKKYELERWVGMCDTMLEHAMRQVSQAGKK